MPDTDPRPTQTTVTIRVRYCECDPMQVAHHASYPVWMEIARTELMREQGACYRDCESAGVFFVVARMSIRYRKPAKYDDEIIVDVLCLPCAGVKVEHRYEIRRGGVLLATAETTLVCVDANGKAVPVPEGLLP
ncbi:MAG: thioesterase family protein [Planctomycetota bacterium]